MVVDLDGTLIRSDLLIESAFAVIGRRPQSIFGMLGALTRGRAALKHWLAARHAFDPATLPYDQAVLEHIDAARRSGRKVYIASASPRHFVEAVCLHLGLDGWFASDEHRNLSGAAKADQLVATFGERGFDYLGDDRADLAVWRRADRAVTVRTSARVKRALERERRPVIHLKTDGPTWKACLRLLRVHQYAKNSLVFVALLTAHQFNVTALGQSIRAWAAFSLCASGVYLLNDLVDLAADRGHPTKRNRPLADGSIPLIGAVAAVPVLVILGLGVGVGVSWPFTGVLSIYLALTTAYSFFLKRKLMLDVVTLAMLYTVRVIGGAVAIAVEPSPWLLAFCLFVFVSLALVKRYTELLTRKEAGMPNLPGRNYRFDDLNVVMSLAAAAGLNAMTVMTLFLNSEEVRSRYHRPEAMWLICPLMIYWLGRILVLAHRREVEDDPIVFTLRDRVSQLTVIGMILAVVAAI